LRPGATGPEAGDDDREHRGHRDERARRDAADRRSTVRAPGPGDRINGVIDPRRGGDDRESLDRSREARPGLNARAAGLAIGEVALCRGLLVWARLAIEAGRQDLENLITPK